jgi:hypothetical protein
VYDEPPPPTRAWRRIRWVATGQHRLPLRGTSGERKDVLNSTEDARRHFERCKDLIATALMATNSVRERCAL